VSGAVNGVQLDARSRVPNRPYYLRDGRRVAASLADLTDGELENPIDVDQNGTRLTAAVPVWTGTDPSGVRARDCSNWFPSAEVNGTQGVSNTATKAWTDTSVPVGCRGGARVYCFQAD
jgi:hypothetical protein